ncbi:mechanosensitive ion channel family protein [Chitinophaga sp. sic0106]|uniref:mechanosensitive ion channel family protein n=1 Tax=Chitinophaga sp. sic0106 TaxID=2854785 RepID=UPI001C440060|nr:mechanosensitive ion channel domain-containing protein [Chitinophaga sp. sic0106]MBV7533826.1 mechanosensitive ion channel [Chitinophaga sp. sic0106]
MSIQVIIRWRIIPVLLCCWLCMHFMPAEAQRKKTAAINTMAHDTLRPADSATISRNLKKAAADTSSESRIRRSDTTVALLINRIENYTLLLNQEMSSLKRGFDTSGITDMLPLIDSCLALVKLNIAGLSRTPNLNDIHTNKIMLDQLERKLNSWQSTLFSYYDRLVEINDTIHSLRRDTAMRNIPSEDELYGFYVGQLSNLITKFRAVDSANRVNLIKIGLLQNKVANRYIEVSDLLEDMNFRIQQFTRHMFNRDYHYIWKPKRDSINPMTFLQVAKVSLHKSTKVLGLFFAIHWPIFFVWLLLTMLFGWWVFYNIRRIRARHADQEAEAILLHSKYLYRFPIASTLLLITTLSTVLSIRYPILYTEIMWFIIMLALTYMFHKQLPKTLFKHWLMLMGLLIVYSLNNLLTEVTYVEQWGVLIGATFSVILGIRLFRETSVSTFAEPKYTAPLLIIYMLTAFFSLVAVLIARVSLAKILGSSAVVNTFMAVNLYVVTTILLEAVYLQVEANKTSSSFISFVDYQEVQNKLRTLFTVLAFFGWLVLVSRNLYMYEVLYNWLSNFLSTNRTLGSLEFTFRSIIVFVIVIWVAFVVSQLISYLFGSSGQQSTGKKNKLGSAILLLRLTILAGGFLLAFSASGIPMDKIAIVIGALGVGIGFGLQNVVNNLVSGIILAFEKPIEVGDVIELGTRSGVVKEIGIRSSKISAYDGSEVIVPNGDLISQQLINWTLTSRNRRVDFTIGVAYGSDVQQVKDIINSAFTARTGVLTAPAPLILLSQFADNSINFKVYFWISELGDAGPLQSDVLAYIYDEFNRAGIELPYPQRDLHIRSVDESVIRNFEKPDEKS